MIAQFFKIDKTNPPVEQQHDFMTMTNPPTEIKALLQNACYDCHSNETAYPWYTNVAPLSFWIKGHINGGREHLNFSEWGNYTKEKQIVKKDECAEWVGDKKMPLLTYTFGHPEAKLSEEDRQKLVDWFKTL